MHFIHRMEANKLLIIGLVWPEPTSSGGGVRTVQLIHLFLEKGYEITFASAASKSDFSFNLQEIGVTELAIKLNDNDFNKSIRSINPAIVLFDRFMIEEQYGWRVEQECPDAVKILDTIDLHFLRNARQVAVKKDQESDLFSDMAKREIACILKCDLSLMISETEVEILKSQFKIEESLLYYLPFLEKEMSENDLRGFPTFEEREGFTFIGNYLHEPNWNAVQVLKTKIWPKLSKRLPGVPLNIYGAYVSQKVSQLNSKKENFNILGRAEDARETVGRHRILLAPLLFGAGSKTKLIDAMQTGTPSITTTVGAESMQGDLSWNGAVEDDLDQFIEQAVAFYESKTKWLKAQQNGIKIINERYGKSKFQDNFIAKLNELEANLNSFRQKNFFGQLLRHHSAQSTKYMSLWIEEKNKNAAN